MCQIIKHIINIHYNYDGEQKYTEYGVSKPAINIEHITLSFVELPHGSPTYISFQPYRRL